MLTALISVFCEVVVSLFFSTRVIAHSLLVKQRQPLRETLSSLLDLEHREPRLTDELVRQETVVLNLDTVVGGRVQDKKYGTRVKLDPRALHIVDWTEVAGGQG